MVKPKSTRRKTTRRAKKKTKKAAAGAVKPKHLRLDGSSLSIERLAPLARGGDLHLKVAAGARARVKEARALIDHLVERFNPHHVNFLS